MYHSIFTYTAVFETYEITAKHTILPMGIFGSCLGMVLLFLIALYRKLAPQSSHQQNSYYIDATLPFKAKEIEGIGEKKNMRNCSCTFCFKTDMYQFLFCDARYNYY